VTGELGHEKIFVLRLTASVDRRLPRTWIPWLALSGWPLVIEFVGGLLPGQHIVLTEDEHLLLIVLAVLNAGALAGAGLAWRFATRRAHAVDRLVALSGARDRAVAPFYAAFRTRYQAVLPLGLGLLPIIWSVESAVSTGSRGSAEWLILASISWTLMLVGNDIWWLLVPPLFIMRLRDCDDLDLRWHDPARTPGIRTLAEGYGFAASFLVLAAFGATLPALLGRPLFGGAVPYIYYALIGLSLWVGVGTQMVIYYIVRRARLVSLDSLEVDSPLPRSSLIVPGNHEMPALLADKLSAYTTLMSATNLPYGSATVVQYLAALVGSLAGFVLQARG
jgi:hypothetical protein